MPATPKFTLTVEGRQVAITNPDKVFYPSTGFTKAEMVDYYVRIAPALLPHMRDRPVSMKRYPHGVVASYFFQKEAPPEKPAWIKTTPVPSQERGHINYILCNDLPTLAWLANAANLEVHTFMHRAPRIERPTQIAFDLDPGPGCDAVSCGKVALLLKERLDALGLRSFVKVSGSKGVQMHVPLNVPATYEDTKLVSRTLAFQLAKERPDEVTGLMRKELRANKVFIDWSQNDEHKTTVCVYSMRGTEKPSIAAPLEWDELRSAVEAEDLKALRFAPDQVLKRVAKMGDLFEEVETLKQKLPVRADAPAAPAPAKPKPTRHRS